MKERINWIDWVKAWCMTVVVFDHTPHDASPFLLQFFAATNLSSFFFISGYLKKPVYSQNDALKKYVYCLIIPYLIYNAIYYPYWLCKLYIEHGELEVFDYLMPIIGTFLGQLNSSFSCELNGVTWFLVTLFLMHWITDTINRQIHQKTWMFFISIIAIILYGFNKYYHFAPYLPFHGLVRCICFFFMGSLFKQINTLKETRIKKDLPIGLLALTMSLITFYWHIHEKNFISHILSFYIANFFSVIAIIYLWRCADSIKLLIVTYISIGTMIIFGIHRIIIGIIDYAVEKAFQIQDISYNYYEAVVVTICIELTLLPLFLWAQSYFPILLGKKKRGKFG